MGVYFVGVLLAGAMLFGSGLLAGLIAWQKGYRPWFWLISMGPIGLVVIALIPNVTTANTPEERDRMESRCDWLGGILSGFTALPLFTLPAISVLAFLSFRAPAPVLLAPPPTVVTSSPVMTVEEPAPAAGETEPDGQPPVQTEQTDSPASSHPQ